MFLVLIGKSGDGRTMLLFLWIPVTLSSQPMAVMTRVARMTVWRSVLAPAGGLRRTAPSFSSLLGNPEEQRQPPEACTQPDGSSLWM